MFLVLFLVLSRLLFSFLSCVLLNQTSKRILFKFNPFAPPSSPLSLSLSRLDLSMWGQPIAAQASYAYGPIRGRDCYVFV